MGYQGIGSQEDGNQDGPRPKGHDPGQDAEAAGLG